MQRTILGIALALMLLAVPASAATWLNEIYASHSGTDDQEFIELIGDPGLFGDLSVVVIEGDSSSSTGMGIVDRVWDLSAETMPTDGYFVLGDTAVANVDFVLGASNTIENGSETFLLIQGNLLTVGDDIDANNDGIIEAPFDNPGTILDSIGLIDGGYTGGGAGSDNVYYGAGTAGPDGSFLPAGIFRTSDFPNPWDPTFLDFSDTANLDRTRTPGGQNVPEPASLALLALGLGLGLRRRR
ncbi:MAG: PEP-CTERM sorting domain-containing protein [Phycisphaerae bacterium]